MKKKSKKNKNKNNLLFQRPPKVYEVKYNFKRKCKWNVVRCASGVDELLLESEFLPWLQVLQC